MTTDWPDRLYIDNIHHEKYLELLGKGGGEVGPFQTLKEIFMYSVILGVLNDMQEPVKKKKELIFEKYLDSKTDKPLLQCIYLLATKKDESILDKKGAVELLQEYANGGFGLLYEIVNKGYDKVEALAHHLIKNHIKQSDVEHAD